MKYKYIFFDLDGTMIDTSRGIIRCLDETIEHFRFKRPDEEHMKLFIGPPLNTSFREAFDLDEELLETSIAFFRKKYADGGQFDAVVYDGILPLLKQLKENDFILGATTLKFEKYAKEILDHFQISQFLNVIAGTDSDLKSHSKENVLLNAFKKLDITNLNEVVLIGDSYFDAEGAEKCGIDFIAVSYGFGFTKEYQNLLKTHNMVANSPNEIFNFIK